MLDIQVCSVGLLVEIECRHNAINLDICKHNPIEIFVNFNLQSKLNSRHLNEILVFCVGMEIFAAKLIEHSPIFTMRRLLVKVDVDSDGSASISVMMIMVLNVSNWGYYLMETSVNITKSLSLKITINFKRLRDMGIIQNVLAMFSTLNV